MIHEATFITVFDASQGHADWGPVAMGALFACAGALMVFRPELMRPWMPEQYREGLARKIFSWFFFIFTFGWTVWVTVDLYSRDLRIGDAFKGGHFQIVEGIVTNFVPMPPGGHSATGPSVESFTVGGASFSYSDFRPNGGFNTTSLHGGWIREGRHVRVTYLGNVILRLEVADPA